MQTMFSPISPQSSQCFPNTTWQQEQKITGAMFAQRAQIGLGILSQENQLFQICLVLCFLTKFNITRQSWLFCWMLTALGSSFTLVQLACVWGNNEQGQTLTENIKNEAAVCRIFLDSHRNPCIHKFSWKFWNLAFCKVGGLLTRAFARLDILWHHWKFQFEFCVNLFECCVNFGCKASEMKTKNCNCIAKTKRNLASTKTRKWVIVILHLPLQRYLTVKTKKLNWSIAINQETI